MSRSYKKTPIEAPEKDRFVKKSLNRKQRREKIDYDYDDNYENYNHKKYKKKFESQDLMDFPEAYFAPTFEEYYKGVIETWERWSKDSGKPCPTEKEVQREYYKLFRNK